MDKLVTVIMPTYKGADNIEKSVQSVLQQSYKNIELIIIDDNGLNTKEQIKTKEVLSKYKSDKRLIYLIHEKNINGSAARNTGIKKSKGEYIAFLDDDDYFLKDKIKLQVELFNKLGKEYGLLYGGLVEEYSEHYKREIIPMQEKNFLFNYLSGKLFVCSSTIMIRREIIDTVGLWDESFKRHQDMEFIVRVANKYEVSYIDKVCVTKKRLDRNLPKNGENVEMLRMHYLNKMKDIINKFSEKEQSEIYYYNYLPIGKTYLKSGNMLDAIRIANKSNKPIRMIYDYLKDAFKFLNRIIK